MTTEGCAAARGRGGVARARGALCACAERLDRRGRLAV